MERVRQVEQRPQGINQLASSVASALDELDYLRKRVKFQLSAVENPEGGDTFYSETLDILYIYNSTDGEWKEH